ncbi:MAG: MarR family transcriptional regulator [Lachnospiraceae bacterium]|nr:MarR family transcriptional regulator [Lachnospiraceae bacterium]
MLEEAFVEVYTKFKLNFYRGIFARLNERESSLSASEAFAIEVIYALNGPTISQFADFLQISLPNATYKVNILIKKGYIEKLNSLTDRREYHLRVTPKFHDYYAINQNYITTVMKRIEERFTEKETKHLEIMLSIISRELMPESEDHL